MAISIWNFSSLVVPDPLLFRMITGEEILATVKSVDTYWYIVDWPIKVITCLDGQSNFSFELTKWIDYSGSTEHKISRSSIVMECKAKDSLISAYWDTIKSISEEENKTKLQKEIDAFVAMEPINIIKEIKSKDDLIVEAVVDSIIIESGEEVDFIPEIKNNTKYLKF